MESRVIPEGYHAVRDQLLAMREKSAADKCEAEAIILDLPIRCMWNVGWWIEGDDEATEICREAAEYIIKRAGEEE